MVNTQQLKSDIHRELQAGKTYQMLADEYGVNKAIVWRIANDSYEPKDPEIRKRLGLPLIVIQYKDPVTGMFIKKG